MMRFARQAVRKAPPGSPLAGIYLHALNELTERHSAVAMSATLLTRKTLKQVATSFEQVAPDDERLPGLRHLLAYHMLRSMLYKAALEQFRLIGPWCGAQPWRRNGNAVAAFDAARGTAAKRSRTRPVPTPPVYGMGR